MKNNKKKYNEYFVKIESNTEENSTQGDGEYDYTWSKDTSYTVLGVFNEKKKNNDNYYEVLSNNVFKENDVAYLVFVSTDDGDSFGHATNSNLLPIFLFKEELAAKICCNWLRLYEFYNEKNLKKIFENREKFFNLKNEHQIFFLDDELKPYFVSKYDLYDYFGGINDLTIYKVKINNEIIEKKYIPEIYKKDNKNLSLIQETVEQEISLFEQQKLNKEINVEKTSKIKNNKI